MFGGLYPDGQIGMHRAEALTQQRQARLHGLGGAGLGMQQAGLIPSDLYKNPTPKKKGKVPIKVELQHEVDEWLKDTI